MKRDKNFKLCRRRAKSEETAKVELKLIAVAGGWISSAGTGDEQHVVTCNGGIFTGSWLESVGVANQSDEP